MYDYRTERPKLFTEDGQLVFLRIRDRVNYLLKTAGAARVQEIMMGISGGDSWQMLACVDRLVELGELREVTHDFCAGQHRVFVVGRGD